jgi:molybdopterin converting factor small subunit
MRVAVRYLAQLRQAAGVAAEEVDVAEACLVRDLLARLGERHGEAVGRLLLDAAGALQPTILVFVGDVQVDPADAAPLREGDVVTILTPIAGG